MVLCDGLGEMALCPCHNHLSSLEALELPLYDESFEDDILFSYLIDCTLCLTDGPQFTDGSNSH